MDFVLSTSHFPIFGMFFSFFSDPHRDHLTVIMASRLEHPSRAYFSDISQLYMDILRHLNSRFDLRRSWTLFVDDFRIQPLICRWFPIFSHDFPIKTSIWCRKISVACCRFMRELAEWHASRHDPPVQGDPVLGRSGEIITVPLVFRTMAGCRLMLQSTFWETTTLLLTGRKFTKSLVCAHGHFPRARFCLCVYK